MIRLKTLGGADLRHDDGREIRPLLTQPKRLALLVYLCRARDAVALVHAALGQLDSAFTWLQRGVQERTHWLVWLNRDVRWAPIRADPRFNQLVKQVGLPP